MDRATLDHLSRDELIDFFLAQIATFRARIAELEAEVADCGGPPKTPDSSSIPPSRGFKPNRAGRRAKKRGPKRGHVGISHRRQQPDTIVRYHPPTCRGCGGDLADAPRRRVGRRQVVELPELKPVVIEAWLYRAIYPGCGERTTGTAPAGPEPSRTFGPRIEALVAYLHTAHHLSHERPVAVCGSVFGLQISEGAIAAALARVAERAAADVAQIAATVRGSPVINSDETGVRVAGRNWWHRVFQTPEASFHQIVPSRGGHVPKEFPGDVVPEV